MISCQITKIKSAFCKSNCNRITFHMSDHGFFSESGIIGKYDQIASEWEIMLKCDG
ncbi:hypothetical protein HanRHA438_Chr17g0801571 [Helianthus annuus]|nr:hypothetical protein HanHA300_Chr17g0645031 [Helianthus annuus]KAJ0446663.1 hypothetical protein HanHA89_Chr17g0696721 [Helianthus annuus]KAJ0825292.1 hypothetical protein HanRHA438_Chr17g0801571 [Helianthus annuus]